MTGNGWACCNILFPMVCHTLTGQPTASTDTQRLHRNMDISKFSKRTLNFDISRFDCTCTRHENINNELLNTSQALCWLDTYDVVISHSELLWITCTVYNYDSSSQLSFSALAVFSRNALYKSTFYLLTYLLTCPIVPKKPEKTVEATLLYRLHANQKNHNTKNKYVNITAAKQPEL